MNNVAIVEAALFCAGRPIETEEIAEATGLTVEEAKESLRTLLKNYSQQEGAIEIARIGSKHVMQLRGSYAERVTSIAETRLPKEILKTAALIAFHQPVKQSNLQRMIGGKVYDHVRTLKEMNLIVARARGNTVELSTSKSFPNYFGIDATNREDIRRWFQEQTQAVNP